MPVAGVETVIGLGHDLSEGRDSLLTFAMSSLRSDPGIVERVVAGHLGIDDYYAYALAAGPCARDAVVIYRDPEDEEQPCEPDEDEDAPPDRRDVYGFHGFYLRRLADAALLDRVEVGIGIANWDRGVRYGLDDRRPSPLPRRDPRPATPDGRAGVARRHDPRVRPGTRAHR